MLSENSFFRAILLGLAYIAPVVLGQDYSCSRTKGCGLGCCGPLDSNGIGTCGLGPTFCGTGCTSQCDQKSECDPGWGPQWSSATECPLKVCCSKFGFCGTTAEFCGGKTVASPQCSGRSSDKRTIGYYESWNLGRPCGAMAPEDIPLGYYTQINFAFALIDPVTYHISPMDASTEALYTRVTGLKARQPDLKVWIAIGGWSMNDPDQATRTTFSDIAGSTAAQDAFFESLITFMVQNSFDGVDIDWEYPGADDRSGRPEDFANFPVFLRRLRERLNRTGRTFGISITLPASFWYLRHFDISAIEPSLDYFNIMTYDIHGTWDANIPSLGAYALAHTNLTEIHLALELLWRNNINPGRVVLGLGFYGRSFTMKDPGCMHSGCPFTGGAHAGRCTGTPGVLSGAEIRQIIAEGATVTTDTEAAVKIVTWDNDQWVSWDDEETLKTKVDYANAHCLGGTMVWAIDLDDGTYINALGKGLSRPKVLVPEDASPFALGDLGTPWM